MALGLAMQITTEYSGTNIEAMAPGFALVRSLYESTLRGEGGFTFPYGGALMTVWVHEADVWRILSGHASSRVPREGAERLPAGRLADCYGLLWTTMKEFSQSCTICRSCR